MSTQTGLDYRDVALSQGGLVHFRSYAGCIFDYRLIAPAQMLGLEYPAGQDPGVATATFRAGVNDPQPYTRETQQTSQFLGRASPARRGSWWSTHARRQAAACRAGPGSAQGRPADLQPDVCQPPAEPGETVRMHADYW